MLTIAYPVPYTPATENSYTRTAILPPAVACPRYPILNFVSQLGDGYNCQSCTQKPYFRSFERGDIIPIQVNLPDRLNGNTTAFGANASTANPQVGWRVTGAGSAWYVRAEIYDAATGLAVVGYDVVDAFCSDWWVGYSDRVGSVQTLFIDTAMLPNSLTTWYIRIAVRSSATAGNFAEFAQIFSEPYCLAPSCRNSVLLTSTYVTIDCEGRDYRQPELAIFGAAQSLKAVRNPFNAGNPVGYIPTPFFISERYLGSVASESFNNEKKEDDLGNVRSYTRVDTYRFIISEMLPPYAARMLALGLFGSSFSIDGEEYQDATQVAKNVLAGLAFLPNVELTKRCQINNNSCN